MEALTWFTFTFVLFGMLVMVMASTKFISQGTAGIVERMGKYVKTVGPGVHFITPIFSRMIRISLKEQVDHYSPQAIITREGLWVQIDAFLLYRIIDAKKALYDVENYLLALETLTMATLRDVVGGMSLSECLASREVINAKLRVVLDENTSRFGIKVTGVEIKTIEPPDDFRKAMEQEKRAEIQKIADITISQGQKQAAINKAEGEKQASINVAEGEGKAMMIRAEAERESARLRAEGQAKAYESLFTALKKCGIDQEIIAIRYLEALEKVAQGNATTLILPFESSGILGAIAGMAKTFATTNGNGDLLKKAADITLDKPEDETVS